MTDHILIPAHQTDTLAGPLMSVAPIALADENRLAPLEVRVTAPMTKKTLPIVVLSHGHGPSQYVSSLYGYASLANYLAASGFAVLQPTHLDSMTLGLRGTNVGEAPLFWRSRASDISRVLDTLDELAPFVPQLADRLDPTSVAVVGHSMGGHTAGMVLGAQPRDPATGKRVDARDERVTAGVMMAAPGRGGDALNPNAARHYPVLKDTDFTTMSPPTLVVAGDQDHALHLNTVGAQWQTDAYRLAPAPKYLLNVHGGEHSLGGISGYEAAEATDENLPRAALVMRMTAAFLRMRLGLDRGAWAREVTSLRRERAHMASVEERVEED